jgi:uncharacterized protein YdhG (YjbR/CyaY superfamily)
MTTKPENTDSYIAGFTTEIQQILQTLRTTIKKAAPEAVESISYGIPTFKIKSRPLVYFAAFKNHIGFYALPSGNDAFQKELLPYKRGKGSVQFPLNEPLPLHLITKIVEHRLAEMSPPTKQ